MPDKSAIVDVKKDQPDDDDEPDDPITVSDLIPASCELIIKHSNKPV